MPPPPEPLKARGGDGVRAPTQAHVHRHDVAVEVQVLLHIHDLGLGELHAHLVDNLRGARDHEPRRAALGLRPVRRLQDDSGERFGVVGYRWRPLAHAAASQKKHTAASHAWACAPWRSAATSIMALAKAPTAASTDQKIVR